MKAHDIRDMVRAMCSYGWKVTFIADGIPASADYTTKTLTIAMNAPCDLGVILSHELNHIIVNSLHNSTLKSESNDQG